MGKKSFSFCRLDDIFRLRGALHLNQVQGGAVHHLVLYTHSMCFSRKEAPGLIRKALEGLEGVHFEEKDLLAHAEEARKAGAQMSPTLVLDGRVLCVGIPAEDELRRLIRGRARHS